MFRMKALNEPSSSEDNAQLRPKEACQEILEEAALKKYKEGLLLQKSELWIEAANVYKDVLSSSVIMRAEPVDDSTKVTEKGLGPLYGKTGLSIRYACFKNLAEVHRNLKQYELALDYYSEALDLDGTDVTVWYRSGLIASKLGLIDVASQAFMQGIQRSNQNWPCLDRACLSLYVMGDYPKCLEVISKCFEINNDFSRGFILRDLIFDEQPSLKQDILELCPNINLLHNKKYSGPDSVKSKLLEEIKTLRSNKAAFKEKSKPEPVEIIKLTNPLNDLSWFEVGSSLVSLRNWMLSLENPISLLTSVDLLESISQIKVKDPTLDMQEEEEPMDIGITEEDKKEPSEEEASETEDKRAKRRAGADLMEELLWSGKRRSARVRSSRKEHESWSVADALRNILPRKLLHQMKILNQEASKSLDEDSMDTMELYKLFEKQDCADEKKVSLDKRYNVEEDRDKMVAEEGYFGTLQEEGDVRNFIEAVSKKGLFEVVQSYISSLEKMWTKTWPKRLILIFIECFKIVKSTNPLRWTKLHDDRFKDALLAESGAILFSLELIADRSEIRLNDSDVVFDLHGLKKVSGEVSHFPSSEAHATFLIRFLWLSANINLKLGNTSAAILYLNAAIDTYDELPALREKTVRLRNCVRSNEITKAIVQATLSAISRKKSLAEVIRLYENESYEEVKKTLIESFSSDCDTVLRKQDEELVDRQTQLSMLANALHHLEDFKECVFWLEVSCHELLGKVNNSDKTDYEEENQTWQVEFDRLLVAMEECCEQGKFKLIEALPLPRLSRFVQTLCCVICRQIEGKERPPCASRPWTMLNFILVALEESEGTEIPCSQETDLGETDLPASVLVLFTAHDYLGRREWCNCDGNVLLFLIMDQVIPKLRLPEWAQFRETVQQHLEQVIFCLYAHPNKKSKARYITEHNVSPIDMTWERAVQIFDLFRPDEIPCFDSLRANIISAETEVLLRKIASLIPNEIDPGKNTESMKDFLYGKVSTIPSPTSLLPLQVKDLFYILGDFYVKTHESAKAVNYLLVDLCANPDRLDSWASIAFSKVYMLELHLNSCAPIDNEEFLEEAMAVTRCFEHCLKLDQSICTIWIEYGNFSYSIHSFCSQRMKLESDSLSLEQFEEIENTKTKMLETAKNAFMNANQVWNHGEAADRQDERWLHHYMLGKICEKHGDLAYLDYYNKAAQLLYENNAQYPKKVSYNSPQTYAIEALEIFYRIHVCVIKCLELQNGEPLDEKTRSVFLDALEKVANGPFYTLTSKSDLQKKNAKAEEERETEKKRTNEIVKELMDEVLNILVVNEEIKMKQSLSTAGKDASHEKVSTETSDISIDLKKSEDNCLTNVNTSAAIEPAKKKLKIEGNAEKSAKAEEKTDLSHGKIRNSGKSIDSRSKIKKSRMKNSNYLSEVKHKKAADDHLKIKHREEAAVTDDSETDKRDARHSSLVVLNSSDMEDNEEAIEEYQALSYAPGSAYIPPNQPVYFEQYPHEQLPDDNYYMTLDDFQEEPVKVPKVRTALPRMRSTSCKKRSRQRAISPGSSGSDSDGDIKYADDSSSSSSSSSKESKKSHATSSSSSSDTSDSEGEKEPKKTNDKSELPTSSIANDTKKDSTKENVVDEKLKVKAPERPKPIEEKKPPIELDPEAKMLQQCLRAFEICTLRFTQHYKSIYRLAHFFYRSKQHRDLNKCRDLLLGQTDTSDGVITGLFSERKNSNFFNGIWRLPAGDVDRPGSFASHMSRSVLLLLEVLRDLRDHKLLFEMSLQLRKVPEPDKRYLREDERKQLSKQALTLSLQTSRHVARNTQVMTLPIVLDAFRVYRKAQKHIPGKEGAFGECLMECFKRLGKREKCSLDQCLRFCQGEITGKRVGRPPLSSLPPSAPVSDKPKMKKARVDKPKEDNKLLLQPAEIPPGKQTKTQTENTSTVSSVPAAVPVTTLFPKPVLTTENELSPSPPAPVSSSREPIERTSSPGATSSTATAIMSTSSETSSKPPKGEQSEDGTVNALTISKIEDKQKTVLSLKQKQKQNSNVISKTDKKLKTDVPLKQKQKQDSSHPVVSKANDKQKTTMPSKQKQSQGSNAGLSAAPKTDEKHKATKTDPNLPLNLLSAAASLTQLPSEALLGLPPVGDAAKLFAEYYNQMQKLVFESNLNASNKGKFPLPSVSSDALSTASVTITSTSSRKPTPGTSLVQSVTQKSSASKTSNCAQLPSSQKLSKPSSLISQKNPNQNPSQLLPSSTVVKPVYKPSNASAQQSGLPPVDMGSNVPPLFPEPEPAHRSSNSSPSLPYSTHGSANSPPISHKKISQLGDKPLCSSLAPQLPHPSQKPPSFDKHPKAQKSSSNLPSSSSQKYPQDTNKSSNSALASIQALPRQSQKPSIPQPAHKPSTNLKVPYSAPQPPNIPAVSIQKVSQSTAKRPNTPPSLAHKLPHSTHKRSYTLPPSTQKLLEQKPLTAPPISTSLSQPPLKPHIATSFSTQNLPQSSHKQTNAQRSTAQATQKPSSSDQKIPQPAHKTTNVRQSSSDKFPQPAHKVSMGLPSPHEVSHKSVINSSLLPMPAHIPMFSPLMSSQKEPPPAHKPSTHLTKNQVSPVLPPRPPIEQSSPNSSKFSIDNILGKNPGLTIVQSKASSSKTSSSEQIEAINLSPQKKSQSPAEPVKRSLDEANASPPTKKFCSQPEVVTIDD